MKNKSLIFLTSVFVAFIVESNGQPAYCGKLPETKISSALKVTEKTHYINYWFLQEFSGENKTNIFLHAIKIGRNNSTENIEGIKVDITYQPEISNIPFQSNSKFEAYIEKEEYPQLIVAIDQMLTDLRQKENSGTLGAMNFITRGGIKTGFELLTSENFSYLGFVYDEAFVMCKFSNAERFLTDLRATLEIASRGLYLPENEEKMRKVKKGTQEVEDVKVDDI